MSDPPTPRLRRTSPRSVLARIDFVTTVALAKAQLKQNSPESQPARRGLDEGGSGTLQKMIVASGSVTMDIDLNRINGISYTTGKLETLHFGVAPNSFFPVLVFNNVFRGAEA